MGKSTHVTHIVFITCLLAICGTMQSARGAGLAAGTSAQCWSYDLAPYAWIAGLNGDVGVGGESVKVDLSFSDILPHVNAIAALRWSGRKDRQAFYIDVLYLKLSDDVASPDPTFTQVHTVVKETILEGAYAYRVSGTDLHGLDALAGFRFWNLRNDLTFQSATEPSSEVSQSKDWIDPIIGLHYRSAISPQWSFAVQGDIGGFGVGSQFTWQLYGGFKYKFSNSYAMGFDYRALHVDYDKSGFLFDTTTQGPLITFDFTY